MAVLTSTIAMLSLALNINDWLRVRREQRRTRLDTPVHPEFTANIRRIAGKVEILKEQQTRRDHICTC